MLETFPRNMKIEMRRQSKIELWKIPKFQDSTKKSEISINEMKWNEFGVKEPKRVVDSGKRSREDKQGKIDLGTYIKCSS